MIYASLPTTFLMLQIGDWASTYSEETPKVYSNFVEYFSINFSNYCRILAFVLAFLMLRKTEKRKYVLPISLNLFAFALLTQIVNAIICTSRSMLFELIALLPSMYLFFLDDISQRKKYFVNIFFVAFLALTFFLFVDVTISRFDTRGPLNSFLSYSGQAPIVFNTQVYGTLDHFLYGDYTLGKLYGVDYVSPSELGGKWETRFYTFVGWLYIDWGVLGSLLIGCAMSLFFYFFIEREKYSVADVFFIFSYYVFLLKGIFVIGRSYITSIVVTITMYVIMKVFLDRQIVKKDENYV